MMFSLGTLSAASVAVAAGLDGDAVVARVEGAMLDQHVAARFRIAAVVVRPMRRDLHAAHRDVRQSTGWISHIGEFTIVTLSINTLRQRYGWTNFGRK